MRSKFVTQTVRFMSSSLIDYHLSSPYVISSRYSCLTEFNRDLYINRWLIQAKEDENENSLDLEEESETAKYYFEYIYEHGEHPR